MQDTVTIRTPSGCLADETRSNSRMYAGVFLVALAVGLAWFPYGALKEDASVDFPVVTFVVLPALSAIYFAVALWLFLARRWVVIDRPNDTLTVWWRVLLPLPVKTYTLSRYDRVVLRFRREPRNQKETAGRTFFYAVLESRDGPAVKVAESEDCEDVLEQAQELAGGLDVDLHIEMEHDWLPLSAYGLPALIAVVGVAFFIGSLWWPANVAREVRDCVRFRPSAVVEVPCTVTWVEVHDWHTEAGTTPRGRAVVHYAYQYEGRTRAGHRCDPTTESFYGKDTVASFESTVGREIVCYVNPRWPDDAVLRVGGPYGLPDIMRPVPPALVLLAFGYLLWMYVKPPTASFAPPPCIEESH